MSTALADEFAALPDDERARWLAKLSPAEAEALRYRWEFWGRSEQMPPADYSWNTFLYLAGRGAGKTRASCEWVRSMVCGKTPLARGKAERVAIVTETAADGRDVMVEGQSGLLGIHPKDFRPVYESSKRRLTWPNGAVATLYNASEPDNLRGPQHHIAVVDELAKYYKADDLWDQLQFGLRLGEYPQCFVSTTPRPIPVIRKLVNDPTCIVQRGSTYDNRANLAPAFIKQMLAKYEGTRLGRQELAGEILDDVPGGLWTRDIFDMNRRKPAAKDRRADIPEMQRIVVAVDPAVAEPRGANAEESGLAETGIVVCGLGIDGRGYVLDDCTAMLSPRGWARRVCAAYDFHRADAVVVELNQGNAMVKAVLQAERPMLPIIGVHSTRGKTLRAEPIAALYEQNRISHVGPFPELEDQLLHFTPYGIVGDLLCDRADALVHGMTELFNYIVNFRDDDEQEDYVNEAGRSKRTGY